MRKMLVKFYFMLKLWSWHSFQSNMFFEYGLQAVVDDMKESEDLGFTQLPKFRTVKLPVEIVYEKSWNRSIEPNIRALAICSRVLSTSWLGRCHCRNYSIHFWLVRFKGIISKFSITLTPVSDILFSIIKCVNMAMKIWLLGSCKLFEWYDWIKMVQVGNFSGLLFMLTVKNSLQERFLLHQNFLSWNSANSRNSSFVCTFYSCQVDWNQFWCSLMTSQPLKN